MLARRPAGVVARAPDGGTFGFEPADRRALRAGARASGPDRFRGRALGRPSSPARRRFASSSLMALSAILEKNPAASLPPEARPRALALSGDANPNLAVPALALLRWQVDDRESFRRLWSTATGGKERRQQVALQALMGALGGKALDVTDGAIASPDPFLRAAAAEALSFLPEAEAATRRRAPGGGSGSRRAAEGSRGTEDGGRRGGEPRRHRRAGRRSGRRRARGGDRRARALGRSGPAGASARGRRRVLRGRGSRRADFGARGRGEDAREPGTRPPWWRPAIAHPVGPRLASGAPRAREDLPRRSGAISVEGVRDRQDGRRLRRPHRRGAAALAAAGRDGPRRVHAAPRRRRRRR